MTNRICKDIGEIYSRLFDARPFLGAELKYFVREFEDKRKDREVEGLFTTLQNTIEIRDSAVPKCHRLSQTQLPELKTHLEGTKEVLQSIEQILSGGDHWDNQRIQNRAQRQQLLTQFEADMLHKISRIDNTFEEKEEELREFYSDLERKLHIHI